MAERTDCSASSALIKRPGGACRPIRCNAEGFEALLRLGDPLLYAHHTGRGVDDLLIEFAPIVADRLDLAFEPRLILKRPAPLGAERFQLLVACLEGIQICGWGLGLRRRRRLR